MSEHTSPSTPVRGAAPDRPVGAPAAARTGVRGWWSRRGKWSKRLLVGVPTAVALYTLIGFFGVPLLLKHVVVPWIGRSLNGAIALGGARSNPYTFELELQGFHVDDTHGRKAIAFERFDVNFELWRSLFRRGWHFQWLRLHEPFVFGEFDAAGVFNLAQLAKPDPEPKEPEPLRKIPHLVIDDLLVVDGAIKLDDFTLPEPFAFALAGLTFDLKMLDTAPETENKYALRATTETGATIVWDGVVNADPLSSHGTIAANELFMPRFMPYGMRYTDARVVDGRLAFELSYDFKPLREPRALTAHFKTIVADSVRIERASGVLATMPKATISDVAIDAIKREVGIRRIELQDGTLLVDREADGNFNVAKMLVIGATGSTVAASSGAPGSAAGERVDPQTVQYPFRRLILALSYLVEDMVGPWSLALDELEIAHQSIDLRDRGVTPNVEIPVRDIGVTAGPVRTSEGYRIPFKAVMDVVAPGATASGDGNIHGDGVIVLADRSVDATIKVDGVELSPGAPYLAILLSPPLKDPTLRTAKAFVDARVTGAAPDAATTTATWSGEMRLEQSTLELLSDSSPLASAERMALRGDGSLRVTDTEGQAIDWKGVIEVGNARSDASLLSAFGLGEGTASLGGLKLDGEARAARPVHAESMTLRWDGEVTLAAVDAVRVELSGPTDISMKSGSARGVAEATVPTVAEGQVAPTPVTAMTAKWTGAIELDSSRVSAPQGAQLATESEKLMLDGVAEATLVAGGGTTLRWKGASTLNGSSVTIAAGAPGELVAGASKLVADGALDATLGAPEAATSLDARWSGSLDAGGAKARTGSWSTEMATLGARGDAVATRAGVADTGGIVVGWAGRLDIGQLLAMAGEDIVARTDTLVVDGALTGEPARPDAYAWKGTIDLTKLGLDASAVAGGVKATADRLHVGGDASIGVGDPVSLAHRGPVEVDGATADAPQIAGALNAALKALRLDGALDLRGSDMKWRGTVRADGATAKAGDVGGPMTLDAQGLTWNTTLDVAGSRMSWSGDATVAPAKVVFGGAGEVGNAKALAFDGAEVVGDLAMVTGGATDVSWKGAIKATKPTIDLGGETPMVAGAASFDSTTTALVKGEDFAMTGDATLTGAGTELAGGSIKAATEAIAMKGIDFSTAAKTLAVAQLAIDKPSIRGDVSIVPPASQGGAEAPKKPAPSESTETADGPRVTPGVRLAQMLPFAVALAEFRLTDGIIELKDGSIEPPTTMLVDEINVTASNFSTTGQTIGTLDAKARVQGSGRFEAVGKLDPFRERPEADVKVTVTGVSLPPYSAVSGRYIGYRMENGRVSTTLPMTITDGKVKGELEFLLDKIKLGDKVQSPDAPNLPIPLGLALLRDQNDQIKGKVPFQGDVTDPEFSLGGLIWQAVLSLLGKIITAPFTLIASAFGGAADVDLSFVSYEPGSSDLSANALSKIDVLGKGLTERPQLALEVVGHITRDADTAALKPMLLREEAKRRLRSSFPTIETVPDDVYRQIVLTTHAGLPTAQQSAPGPGGAAPSFEQIEQAVLATMQVTDDLLRDLAQRRAQRVVDVLIKEKNIPVERVKLLVPEGPEIEASEPKAEFKLG